MGVGSFTTPPAIWGPSSLGFWLRKHLPEVGGLELSWMAAVRYGSDAPRPPPWATSGWITTGTGQARALVRACDKDHSS